MGRYMGKGGHMGEIKYYDGKKLLGTKDLKGMAPEIFISQTSRSYGKTTYYSHKLCEDFRTEGMPFGLLCRWKYELDGIEKRFEDVVRELYYPGSTFGSENVAGGSIKELYWDGKLCGYAFSIMGFEAVKKNSNMLSKVGQYLFDEFMPEDKKYCPRELMKFMSIHTSIARAPHQPVRYVPVYMLANMISMLNPYYMAMGVIGRFRPATKYLRGDGFVLESLTCKDVSELMQESAFNRAFSNEEYLSYLTGESKLYENETIDIGKLTGEKHYRYTFVRGGRYFGMWVMRGSGLYYITDTAQQTCSMVFGVRREDYLKSTVKHPATIKEFKKNVKQSYELGLFRFQTAKCKEMLVEYLLSNN